MINSIDTSFETIIDTVSLNSKEFFDGNELIKLEPINYMNRPLSKIIKIKAIFKDATKDIYVKVFKLEDSMIEMLRLDNSCQSQRECLEVFQSRIKRDYEAMKVIYERFKGYPNYSIIKPIAFFLEFPAIITEESPGINLAEMIEKKARYSPLPNILKKLILYSYKAGKWLKIFQEITKKEGRVNPDTIFEYIDIRMKKIADILQAEFNKKGLKKLITNYYENNKKYIKNSELDISGIHGDFAPTNIIIDADKIIVGDFNNFKYGSIYHDVTRFYHQLELFSYKPIFLPNIISKLQTSFLKGYNDKLEKNNIIFNLFIIQHIICHYIGLLRAKPSSLREKFYNQWVCHRHIHWLTKIVNK